MSSKEQNLAKRARLYAIILQQLFVRDGIGGNLRTATRGARHLSFGVRLHDPGKLDKALKLSETIAYASKAQAILTQRQGGLVIFQYQLPSMYWEYYTRADVTGLGVGLGEMKRQVNFSFDDSPHALIAGTTGSGKTGAMQSAGMALLNTYAPDELQLLVIDPHDDHVGFSNAAHLMAPVARSEEEIDYTLSLAYKTFVRRKTNGIRDDKRLVVIIDEGDEVLMKHETRLRMVAGLVNGRKFRVNVILGSLKPLHKELPNILDKLQNRFIGQVSDAHMSAQLTGRAGLEAHKLTGKGDFLHVEGPSADRFQVAQVTEWDYAKLERAEIARSDTEIVTEIIDIPEDNSEEGRGGRPTTQVDANTLAKYMHNPHALSVRSAREVGITRTPHLLHRDFAQELLQEMKRLNLHVCIGECRE